jgi:multiple sugar transport system substrate-binding protein
MIAAGRWPFGTYVPNKFTTVALQYIPLMAQPRTVVEGMGAFPVLRQTKHPKEAFELSAWLSGPYSQKTGISVDSIPTRISVMKDVLPTTPAQNWQIYLDSADIAKAVQAPPGYPELANIFDRYMSAVYSNQMDVPTAMKQASDEMTKVLASQ